MQLIEEQGIDAEVILYLEHPPSTEALSDLLGKLGMSPRDILRRGEADYKAQGLDNKNLTDEEIVSLMHKFPKLIERPIVVCGEKAVLGRPPENVNALF